VGNIKATIDGAFHSAKDTRTSGSSCETNVKVASESTWLVVNILDLVVLTGGLLQSSINLIQLELVEQTTSQKESSAVRSGVVGQAEFHSVSGKLRRVGSTNDNVALKTSVGNLTNDIPVGDAYNHSVLGSVVLVLGLDDEPLAGVVIGLTLTPPLELDLESLEICFILNDFDESHLEVLEVVVDCFSTDRYY